MMTESQPFWKVRKLQDLSAEEWESLCDGCARCCLIRFQDDETEEVYDTDVACRLLDLGTCRCSDYEHRKAFVPECVDLRTELGRALRWLPKTCAYRRLALGKDLAPWHPLVSGDAHTVHYVGVSIRGKAVSERDVPPDELEDHVSG